MGNSNEQAGTDKLIGQAISLADMVDYQEGSVVSRTVIKQKTGTITMFAFGEDQGLSEHTSPFDAVVYILDGEAEISIGGKPQKVKAGETILMPANVPHALHAEVQFKMLLVLIRGK